MLYNHTKKASQFVITLRAIMWHLKELLLIFLFLQQAYGSYKRNYYWREYTGTAPSDAVVGRTTSNGTNVYIGQIYYKNSGLVVVEIFDKKKEVNVPINGVHKMSQHIKILCGPQADFEWLTSNNRDLQVDLIGKHAVIAGHWDGNTGKDPNYMNIGRIVNADYKLRIGRITWFVGQNGAHMFYYDKGKEEVYKTEYQVLLYKGDLHEASMFSHHYYWREYLGYIPDDAVVGGDDVDGLSIYIGQKYVRGKGLLVVPIQLNERKPHKRFVKVLCGNQNNFQWISVNSMNYRQKLIGKFPVVGGHQDGAGDISIGRISVDGQTQIGKVESFAKGNVSFSFDDEGFERRFHRYQVLVYSENVSTNKAQILYTI